MVSSRETTRGPHEGWVAEALIFVDFVVRRPRLETLLVVTAGTRLFNCTAIAVDKWIRPHRLIA